MTGLKRLLLFSLDAEGVATSTARLRILLRLSALEQRVIGFVSSGHRLSEVPRLYWVRVMTQSAKRARGKSRYLVLGFSLDIAFDGQLNVPPSVVCTTGYNSARLLALNLPHKDGRSFKDSGQWRLVIEVGFLDRGTARRVVSGFECLFTHVYHGRIGDLAMEQLPITAISGRKIVLATLIAAAERRARFEGDVLRERSVESRIRSFFQVPDIINAFVLYQLPTVLQSDWLFSACSFFQSACVDYEFLGDSITNVLRDRRKTADYEHERQKLERLVLSSFRVLEAIVGEPGKDKERFRARLAARGLDFRESVGFPGTKRRPLGEAICWLQELRDSTSAHGIRRRKHPVTWYEAMGAQHLAESVLHQALWNECSRRGRREGTQEEVSYLLTHMYPLCADSDWLTRPFPELDGGTPIEASREPGGPARVQHLAELISGGCVGDGTTTVTRRRPNSNKVRAGVALPAKGREE
jgi:hypothetical protein